MTDTSHGIHSPHPMIPKRGRGGVRIWIATALLTAAATTAGGCAADEQRIATQRSDEPDPLEHQLAEFRAMQDRQETELAQMRGNLVAITQSQADSARAARDRTEAKAQVVTLEKGSRRTAAHHSTSQPETHDAPTPRKRARIEFNGDGAPLH